MPKGKRKLKPAINPVTRLLEVIEESTHRGRHVYILCTRCLKKKWDTSAGLNRSIYAHTLRRYKNRSWHQYHDHCHYYVAGVVSPTERCKCQECGFTLRGRSEFVPSFHQQFNWPWWMTRR